MEKGIVEWYRRILGRGQIKSATRIGISFSRSVVVNEGQEKELSDGEEVFFELDTDSTEARKVVRVKQAGT